MNEYLETIRKKDEIEEKQIQHILESFTLLLPVVPSLRQPILLFLTSIANPFELWLSPTSLKPWTTLYRLLPFVVDEIRMVWNWKSLFQFVSCEKAAIRYYAVQIICALLNKSEKDRHDMEKRVGVDLDSKDANLVIEVKREEERFADRVAEQRRLFLQRSVESVESSAMDVESSGTASESYVEVCGYIIPCKPKSTSVTATYSPFIVTATAERNLSHFCLHMQSKKPILLQGDSGCGKTRLFQYLAQLTHNDDFIQLFLDDQMDSKALIGNYVCTDKPGEFVFQPGTLTQAITAGKWVIIEDVDKIPFDIVSCLLPIIEKGELSIPSRGVTLKVHKNFRLFGTSCQRCTSNSSPMNNFLCNHWLSVDVQSMDEEDLAQMVEIMFPALQPMIRERVVMSFRVLNVPSRHELSEEHTESVLALLQGELQGGCVTREEIHEMKAELLRWGCVINVTCRNGKPVTCRDVLKWCERLASNPVITGITNQSLSEQTRKIILDEALDVFAGCLPAGRGARTVAHVLAIVWNLSVAAVDSYVQNAPSFSMEGASLHIGRVELPLAPNRQKNRRFYQTKQSLRLMQQIAACITHQEPMLLVGETGCGKTTVIQYIAECIGQQLVVMNMNEQTQCSDLIGGFKPVDLRQLAIPLFNRCCELFNHLFMDSKHADFKPSLKQALDGGKYTALASQLKSFCAFATSKIEKAKEKAGAQGRGVEKYEKWLSVLREYAASVAAFEKKVLQVESSFAFSFVPGPLVTAIEQGKWVLLDELNLAPGEVLQRLSGLLESTTSSLVLSERGDVTPIKRHPNFRIFAAMNPATDVGKKALAAAVRNRFSEFYVNELTDRSDLELIVRSALRDSVLNDERIAAKIVDFYLRARECAKTSLVDGGNKAPHYSLRTLCRALEFVNNAESMKLSGTKALYEGLCMSFLTMLNVQSQAVMKKLILAAVFDNQKVDADYTLRNPGGRSTHDDYVQVNRYWLQKGELPPVDLSKSADGQPPRFILTASVQTRLDDLCRAVLMKTCPVLLQGPTSSGKTSMITYLAALTGHKCVRINNHEYTDLQDYTGIYVSSPSGQLVFHEGLLVEALRKGYWVILDELNLAPSEVLEALNRLLDDNRELFIPETNTVVRPHPNFMLFATQNPPGKYGGRKVLSRAFRNRFLEMHVEDLPGKELKEIIVKRCCVYEGFAKQMIQVMERLQAERQNSNVFAGKDGFITPRDLLRWGNRCPKSKEELAYHGYLLLAERLRRDDERAKVKEVLEEVCKVKIDLSAFYLQDSIVDAMMDPVGDVAHRQTQKAQLWNLATLQSLQRQIREEYEQSDRAIPSGLKTIAITGTLQKMFKLIGLCLHYNEPVLLVGGTGCGKTTAVQLVAEALKQKLVILNCHAHTETSDILGGQRPSRSHEADAAAFQQSCCEFVSLIAEWLQPAETMSVENPSLAQYQEWILQESPSFVMTWLQRILSSHAELTAEQQTAYESLRRLFGQYQQIFVWQDGPLLTTMKRGDIFLLDEISLAEDAVLERMNSILESERQITVPEKGGDCIEVITAAPSFRILATMNPGGDFGKKELSAALRNRFTEIWVSSLNGLDDLKQIMSDRIRMHERATAQFAEVSAETHSHMVEVLHPFIETILAFVDFFNQLLNQNTTDKQNHTEATCRDILSIIDFMKIGVCHLGLAPAVAFTEAIHMILLDGLGIGTNMNSAVSAEYKKRCYDKLFALMDEEQCGSLQQYFASASTIVADASHFGVTPYFLPVRDALSSLDDYHFDAPTTCSNLKRVLRALQLHKPILLEGSPGVGKTSLIMAIAQVIGQPIVRINLSEQTDMADLLGSDLPVPAGEQTRDEKGNAVQFRWSDGVLLSGIKSGAWILLDELNLASQQVLEGLNSCLDHRATVYIPEIDKEFQCPPTFQIFACQNPLEEGGGRKGLPRSFINRFARVYVETLKEDDMTMISKQLMRKKLTQYYGEGCENCAGVDWERVNGVLEKMVDFVVRLDALMNHGYMKNVNSFEFNLRDIFRWCDLMLANQSVNELDPSVFVNMLFLQRVRNPTVQQQVLTLYQQVFDTSFVPCRYPRVAVSSHTIQIGHAVGHRYNMTASSCDHPLYRGSLQYLESLLFATQNKLPCLLVGESGSGKSAALHALASLLNVRLYEYSMNTTTDATEILGCFEQIEVSRHYSRLLTELIGVLQALLWDVLVASCDASTAGDFSSKRLRMNSVGEARGSTESAAESIGDATQRKRARESAPSVTASSAEDVGARVYSLINYLQQQVALLVQGNEAECGIEMGEVLRRCEQDFSFIEGSCTGSSIAQSREILTAIEAIQRASNHVAFEWIDGSLIEAIVRGYWVVFDNANFCNASVLDRLNSLLENNGFLLMNECGLVDGKERVIRPHNNFRIFFVMNPVFGEISRAMRNRCVELFVTPDVDREVVLSDEFDLVNQFRINDLNLVLLVLQVDHDLREVLLTSLLKLNPRYLTRFARVVADQLEGGHSVRESVRVAAETVYANPAVKTYLESETFEKALSVYARVRSFCERHHIRTDCFLKSGLLPVDALSASGNEIGCMHETTLLNYLIAVASQPSVSEETLREWCTLVEDCGAVQKDGMKKCLFLLQRFAASPSQFASTVVSMTLLCMHSGTSLEAMRVVLAPSLQNSATAPLATSILRIVDRFLQVIFNSEVFAQYQAAQKAVREFMATPREQASHIPLFSNNFDASVLCSTTELLEELPLFASARDAVMVRLHKMVVTEGLLTNRSEAREVLQRLDEAIEAMNRFSHVLPLLASLEAKVEAFVEASKTQDLSANQLAAKSVLELSILVHQNILHESQILNRTVVEAFPFVVALCGLAKEMVASGVTSAFVLSWCQSVQSLLVLLESTTYSAVLSSQTSQVYNMQLVAFILLFEKALAEYHDCHATRSATEEEYHVRVASLLRVLQVRSNITIDNKLWSVVGRPLIQQNSAAFASFLELVRQWTKDRFVFDHMVDAASLFHEECLHVFLTEEEKRVVVDAMGTLVWLGQKSEKSERSEEKSEKSERSEEKSEKNEEEKESEKKEQKEELSKIVEVVTQTLRACQERVRGFVQVLDTTFNGSIELDEASKTSVVQVSDAAYSVLGELLHKIVIMNRSLRQQSTVLRSVFSQEVLKHLSVQNEALYSSLASPLQLLSLRQLQWLSDTSLPSEQVVVAAKLIPANQFEYLRFYLEGYWSDAVYGYHIFQDEPSALRVEETREQTEGSALLVTPHTATMILGTIAPLLSVAQKGHSTRDRIECLSMFKVLMNQLLKDENDLPVAQEHALRNELQTLLGVVVQLLRFASPQFNELREDASEFTEARIQAIEASLSDLLRQSKDASTMRYESLLLSALPGLLRLLTHASTLPGVALSVSVGWVMLGFVLFNLLLPSSVIDPLMKDYIEKHTLELMNANLLDNLFVLAFVTMQLNGDVTKCEDSVMEEMHALYSAVVQRNCAAMELLQDGDFKRACSSSFEQLYCVLYSYGSTILSLERLRGLVTRALSHMENSLLASEVGEVTSLVSALWEKMKESAFVIKAGSDEGRTSGDMEALKKEEITFQSSNNSFKQSLFHSYGEYRDVVNPVCCAVSAIQHGLRLLLTLCDVLQGENRFFGNDSAMYQNLGYFAQYPFKVVTEEETTIHETMTRVMNGTLEEETKHKGLLFKSLLLQLLLRSLTVLKGRKQDNSVSSFIRGFTSLFMEQLEEERQRLAEEAKAVEYRTRHVDIENISSSEDAIEAAYKAQFPDYQLLFDEEVQAQAQMQGEEVSEEVKEMESAIYGGEASLGAWRIASQDVEFVYEVMRYFVTSHDSKEDRVTPVREELVLLNSAITVAFEKQVQSLVLTDYEQANALLRMLQLQLAKEVAQGRDVASLLNPRRVYSFHNNSNVSEAEHCVTVLLPLRKRVFEILSLYPTQLVLQYILRLIDHLLQLPITTPLNVVLSGVTVLMKKVNEWNVSAASAVSLKDYNQQLSGLIVRWRKLELESWSSFLDDEEEKIAKKSRERFCELYSLLLPQEVEADASVLPEALEMLAAKLCVRPHDLWVVLSRKSVVAKKEKIAKETCKSVASVLSEKMKTDTNALIEVLDSYLRGSQLLEFPSRLQLLLLLSRFLKLQLQEEETSQPLLELHMNVLYHISRMYSVYLPAVLQYIQDIKDPIAKELKDQVKLGKWDDQSFYSLRETVNMIHHKLFKLIYKYRDANNLKVSVVLDQVISGEVEEKKEEKEPEEMPKIALFSVTKPKEAEAVAVWKHAKSAVSCFQNVMGEQPGAALDEMAVEVITTAAELRKGTDQNRKKLLFKELLNHLESQGVSHLAAVIPESQKDNNELMRLSVPEMRSVASLVKEVARGEKSVGGNLKAFQTLWGKADTYFYKNYLLLVSMRLQMKQETNEELDATTKNKCLGYVESMMLNVLQEREAVLSLGKGMNQVYEQYRYLACVESEKTEVCVSCEKVAAELEVLARSCLEMVNEMLFFDQRMRGEIDSGEAWVEACAESQKRLQALCDELMAVDESKACRVMCLMYGEKIRSQLQRLKEVVETLKEEALKSRMQQNLVSVVSRCVTVSERCDALLLELGQTQQASSEDSEAWTEAKSRVLSVLEEVMKNLHRKQKQTVEGALTYQQMHDALLSSWDALALGTVHEAVDALLDVLLSHPDMVPRATVFLRELVSLLRVLLLSAFDLLVRGVMLNKGFCKLQYVCLKLFKELLKKGFCTPKKEREQKEKEDQEMQDGTGMGEGEGENDVTDQLDGKDQLDGLKGEKKEEKEEEKKADDTGMDVESDFEGEMEDLESDDEEEEKESEESEEEEMEREMGELNDDQEVVDEKLWDESEEEEKPEENEKIEQDEKQQNKKNTDEMTTKEEEGEKKEEEEKEDAQEQEQQEEEEEKEDQINDLNEQEYEDNHFMNQEEEEEEEFPEDMEIEGSEEEEQEEEGEEENPGDMESEEEQEEQEEEQENEENEDAEDMELAGAGDEEEEEEEEKLDVNDPNNNPEEEKEEEKEEEQETLEKKENTMATNGVADETGQDNVLDEETEKKDSAARNEEEEMEQEEEEKEQEQEEGQMKEGAGEEEKKEEEKEEKEEDEMNPYKNPEKAIRQWEKKYERMQMVPQKEEEENQPREELEEEPKPLGAEVKQGEQGQDVLAPSAEDVQFKPQNEPLERVENEEEEGEEEEKEEEKEEVSYEKDFPEETEQDVDDATRREAEEAAFTSELLEKVTKQGASNEKEEKGAMQGVFTRDDIQMIDDAQEVRLPFVDEDSYLNRNVNSLKVSATTDPAVRTQAAAVWDRCVSETAELSSRLTEQLRLLMEPTKASKLSGDFKTGKRINMRKVIPFIASNYRKDKIWLRRSKPSQREYQIMLVIDDSKSMRESNADNVTFKTLALIGSALSQVGV